MPELPEVRIVSRQLNRVLVNKEITDIKIFNIKLVKEIDIEIFKTILHKQVIKNVDNYGKFIIFHFNSAVILLSHLRMEGKYSFFQNQHPIEKHDHLIFYFSDGSELHYNDTRAFGTFHLRNEYNYLKILPLSKMGFEPVKINISNLYDKIHQKRSPIKTVLLDQTNMAGLGNIYVDEVLYATKIIPTRKANIITKNELAEILKYSISIMDKSTELGGSSIQSYTSLNKQEGSYQNFLQVHTKKGMPCRRCKTIIIKIKVNGRGTYYCPNCQK